MKFGVLFLLIHNILYYLHIENNRYNWNDIIHEIRNFTIGLTSQEPLMGAMWFLPALFVVSVIAASTISISKKYTNTNILIFAIPVIGYILCRLEIKSPRCLWEYMQICSIYFIGFYFKKYEDYFKIKSKLIKLILIIMIGILVYILNYNGIYANLQPGEIRQENIISICFIGGLSSLGVYYTSQLIYNIPLINKILLNIGKYSFSIMALHFFCFKFVTLLYIIVNHKDTNMLSVFPNIRNCGIEWTILYILFGIILPICITKFYKSFMTKISSLSNSHKGI